MKILLKHEGHTVIHRLDGVKGIMTAKYDDFDCIVTDYDMPRMNGIEFVNKFRELDDTTKIIFFTSDIYIDNLLTRQMKIHAVIYKDIQELIELLRK